MEFKTDIRTLYVPSNKMFELSELNFPFPRSNEVFFRAKQKEIVDQYAAARVFLNETETHDWNHWFKEIENKKANKVSELMFTSYFYESALTYYNIVVDLSWVLCYVSVEYACFQKEKRVKFSGVKSIDEAVELLRIAEKNVTTPTAENNPFEYLKTMNPDFSNAIDLIIAFWNQLNPTAIRSRYNYCKHRGKPAYSEIEELRDGKLNEVYLTELSTGIESQIASNITDVQLHCSLKEGIEVLVKFDDEVLFPYIRELINELERVLQPWPIV